MKDPAHTGTSKGLSLAINRGPIRKFLPKYAHVYATIQSRGLSAGAWTHYVTDNGFRKGPAQPISTASCVERHLVVYRAAGRAAGGGRRPGSTKDNKSDN